MPMQEDDDLYIETINSDKETDNYMGSIPYHNTDDDSANWTLHDEPSRTSNDEKEEEQYDFDEWFEEQMDIHENGSESSSGKEDDIFVKFLDNISSSSLMDYENEMTK